MEQNRVAGYEMRRLEKEQIIDIYTGPAGWHFPQEELKPLKTVIRLLEEGGYEGLGLFSGSKDGREELAGYALFIRTPGTRTLLLDYYAVMEEYRNGGTGSLFLEKMKELYRDLDMILLETEAPETAADEEERALRNRRNGFYKRNGAVFTQVRSRLFGVEFYISFLPLKKNPDSLQVAEQLKAVYRYMLGEEAYGENVQLWREELDGNFSI